MGLGYRELASELRVAIERGEHARGATLPKQADLAERFGVNIKTVRAAVSLLESEGLVTPVRRRGTVVREQPPMRRLGIDRYAKSRWKFGNSGPVAADREASGLEWKQGDQTQTVALVMPSARVADVLGVDPAVKVYARARTVRLDNRPTHTLTSYYRVEDVEGTPLVRSTSGLAGRGGGFAVLTLRGLEPHQVTETVSARMPTPDETKTLELPAGEPVMILERIVRTKEGRPVEYATGVHAASRFAWTYTFDMPD